MASVETTGTRTRDPCSSSGIHHTWVEAMATSRLRDRATGFPVGELNPGRPVVPQAFAIALFLLFPGLS